MCDLATTSSIKPLWSLGLIKILPAEASLVLSLISGILLSWWPVPSIITFVAYGRRYIEWFLQSVFVPLLPLYVLGFFLKIAHEMPFQALCGAYGIVFAVAVVAQISYLIFSYLVANGFLLSRVVETFMVAFPSYLTAFGTMSSVAALPVSVVAAEKNVKSRSLADVAMPIFANVHLMGDAVAVPLFAVVTMQLFLGVVPTFTTYLIFVGYFCLSMLAVSGIPGGGIIVMLPLFKSLLGFTPEMLGIMTALYLLQDAFGTAANVMGDGALIIVLKKILKTFHLIKDSHE